jgi:hypothetical protein
MLPRECLAFAVRPVEHFRTPATVFGHLSLFRSNP